MTNLALEQGPNSYALLGTTDNLGISVRAYIFSDHATEVYQASTSRYNQELVSITSVHTSALEYIPEVCQLNH